jgi:hypothetical protein
MGIIPSAIQLSLALKSDSVIYFHHNDFQHSQAPHFFVILNDNKENDDLLLLAYATSKNETIDNKRKYCRPETIIEVEPSDYSEFTKKTYFDCNELHEISKSELLLKIETEAFRMCSALPPNILSLIKNGALVSRKVTLKNKKVIKPDYGV